MQPFPKSLFWKRKTEPKRRFFRYFSTKNRRKTLSPERNPASFRSKSPSEAAEIRIPQNGFKNKFSCNRLWFSPSAIFPKKTSEKIWRGGVKRLLLHPLSRGKRSGLGRGKKLQKRFADSKKGFTFATAKRKPKAPEGAEGTRRERSLRYWR